jgi:hypothetical protein
LWHNSGARAYCRHLRARQPRAISDRLPEVAVLGVDVLRDTNTGRLYVLETNPGGFTWHLSSGLAKKTFTPEHIRNIYQQFDALERAAQLLVEKTRAEAR